MKFKIPKSIYKVLIALLALIIERYGESIVNFILEGFRQMTTKSRMKKME